MSKLVTLAAGATVLLLAACGPQTPERQHEAGCIAGSVTGAVLGAAAGTLIGGGTGQIIAGATGGALGAEAGKYLTCG